MMKIFVSMPANNDVTNSFCTKEVREYLESRFDVKYSHCETQLSLDEIAHNAADCDAIITGWGHQRITYDVLKDTKVKIIAHTGGSVGSLVDLSVFDHGIRVLSGNDLYAESVAEGTIAYMLTGLRQIPYYVQDVKNGGWRGDGFFSEGLLDRTVGIVGLGTIARCLIKLLKPFRAKIKIYSSYPIDEDYLKGNNATQVSLEEIFSSCKIVSIHSAMNEKTRGMIGKEHFDLIQDGALFINTARGAIICEDEMIEALKENRFRAVLDVFCKEPIEADSELRRLENVYCIPHMGGPTLDRRPAVTMGLADNILKIAKGEPAELEITKAAASRMTVGG